MVQFHSFTCSCPVFPVLFIEETVFLPVYILASFIIRVINRVSIDAFLILFHWYMCLFLCQYHAVFISEVLWHSLKSRCTFPVLFFSLKFALPALFTLAKIQKQPKCPSTDEWIQNMGVCIYNEILFSH